MKNMFVKSSSTLPNSLSLKGFQEKEGQGDASATQKGHAVPMLLVTKIT